MSFWIGLLFQVSGNMTFCPTFFYNIEELRNSFGDKNEWF
jgi:hypothetical protein